MTKDRRHTSAWGLVLSHRVGRQIRAWNRILAVSHAVVVVVLLLARPNPALAASAFASGGGLRGTSESQQAELPLRRRWPVDPTQPGNLPRRVHPPQPIGPARPAPPGVTPALPETLPPEVAQVLTGMAAQAAVILVGQVRAVDREDAHGYVDVSITVQKVLRGTTASTYVLREWAGLWAWQQDRYPVGERVLMLLRPRSSSGFSSPVGGMDGALPLIGGGQEPLLNADGTMAPDRGAPVAAVLSELANTRVDLRWIAARAIRPVARLHDPGSTAHIAPTASNAAQAARQYMPPGNTLDPAVWPGPVAPLNTGPVSGADGKVKQGVGLSTVLALLNAVPEAAIHAR